MNLRRTLLVAALIGVIVGGYVGYRIQQPIVVPKVSTETTPEEQPVTIPGRAVEEQPVTEPQPATEQQPDNAVPTTRTVTINNAITKKMITYHKALGSYTPKFSIEINGSPVEIGQPIAVQAHNNAVDIKYHYNFLNGYRVGSRTTRVTLPPAGDTFTLTFSWKTDNHVILDGAVAYTIIDEKK